MRVLGTMWALSDAPEQMFTRRLLAASFTGWSSWGLSLCLGLMSNKRFKILGLNKYTKFCPGRSHWYSKGREVKLLIMCFAMHSLKRRLSLTIALIQSSLRILLTLKLESLSCPGNCLHCCCLRHIYVLIHSCSWTTALQRGWFFLAWRCVHVAWSVLSILTVSHKFSGMLLF